jgi:DNA-binding transcriptional MerR regulator
MDTFDYKKYLAKNKLNENSEEKIKQGVRNFYSKKSKEDLLDEIFTILDMFIKEKGLSYDDMARALKAQGHDIDVEDPVQAKRKELFGKENEELEEQTRNPKFKYALKKALDAEGEGKRDQVYNVRKGYYQMGDELISVMENLQAMRDAIEKKPGWSDNYYAIDKELITFRKIKELFNQSLLGEIL